MTGWISERTIWYKVSVGLDQSHSMRCGLPKV